MSDNLIDTIVPSEAAIDIDYMLLNKTKDFTAIRKLIEWLDGYAQCEIIGPVTLNPVASVLISTMKGLEVYPSPRLESELLAILKKFTKGFSEKLKSLEMLDPKENSDEFRQAKNFCIALSRAVIGWRKKIHELNRPRHPWRHDML